MERTKSGAGARERRFSTGPDLARMLSGAEELARMGSWMLDIDTREAGFSDEMYRIHGFEPQSVPASIELLLEHVHGEDRDGVKALLDRVLEAPESVPAEGIGGEYRIVRPDGSVRDLRAHGRLEREGARRLWVGSAQDMTEQRLTERELRAHYAVSQALSEWESFEEGVVDLLRRVGVALEYSMATLWLWSEADDALACRAFWSDPSIDAIRFEEFCRTLRFAPGQGLPGTAWQLRQPVFSPDMPQDERFPVAPIVGENGVRGVLGFPAVGPDGPIAVLACYAFERRTPTDSLLRTLSGLGQQLGRFLAGRRAQLEPRRLSDREVEVLRLASDGRTGPAIAEELVISPSTVKTHFENIYDKLGVSDRAAAVAHAMRIGLIS